ncbi:endonuclease/exonuclease/phosphatase family protein [bacterium]|nr:endonuclease/exonuclease/phosphatase family protein [bacterium]MCI0605609.1 endonuclease/exonuclease/phosphatase family protein [bacterium]
MILLLFFFFFAPADEIEIRVMTFNIWYGGEQVSFAQTAGVIRAADPDLIGVQEPDGNLRQLAEAAGFSFVDEKRNIISRYPLFDPDTDDQKAPYTFVLVRPDRIVAFANVHLTSNPSGPDLLHEGRTPQEVLATERRVRLPEVQPYVKALGDLIARNIPVFFAGDFNTPSHQDWTKEAFEWPVTKSIADAGLRDSYREVHPDAAQKPGLTWTPGYPHPWVKSSELHHRIDMIWSGGKTSAVESKIIGEVKNPAVDIAVDPYPSDHRAVVSTFRVVPAPAPALISVDRPSFVQGSDFLVRFQTPDFGDWSVVVVPHRGAPEKDVVVAATGPDVISTRPSIKFGSAGISPGKYDAVLLDAHTKELARTMFHILAKDAVPELRIEKSAYKPGEEIKVSWRNAPGMKNDWIGVYRANDPDLYRGYIAFVYTGAAVEGSTLLDKKVLLEPLTPGEYELRLMREDSYVMLAKAPFGVRQ